MSLLAILLASTRVAVIYHVALTGSDAFSGTEAKPFRTIQRACNVAANGDTVLVHAGKFVERVILRSSITLANAPGEVPVIDGTGLSVSNSHGLLWIKDLNNVTVRGLEFANYKTTVSSALPIGILVEGKCNRVTLQKNHIHHIQNTGSGASTINGYGIAVFGNSSTGKITNLVIDGNEIHDTKTGSSETLTINGNVDGFQVTNNSIHDVNNIGIDCIGFEGTSPIPGEDQARNGLIRRNLVYNVTSAKNLAYGGSLGADGIYVDGGTAITIERNVVHHVDIGVEVASEHLGKDSSSVTVRNNLIYSSGLVGLSIGGYDSKRGGTSLCRFFNNTLVGNDTSNSGTGEVQIQFHTSGNIFQNNLISASPQGIMFSSVKGSGPIGLVSDYNLFFTSGSPSWQWNGLAYGSLGSFGTASGNDKHSLFANPGFVNTATGNYHLSAASAAIDKGLNLSSSSVGNIDLGGAIRSQGSRIDLGCFEATPKVP